MGLWDRLKTLWTSDKLDVSKRFEFTREAVSGTMSHFRAVRDVFTGKFYGLKLLDAEKTAFFEGRFKGLKKPSEGEISLKIKHPRVVETYEYGLTTSGQQYILMELVEGVGLHVLLNNREPALPGKRLSLARQMLEAIEAVHAAGFIHRDICPRNYICAWDLESLKLIDFGLTVPATREFCQPGNRTGTPLYMAPEIVRRRPTDIRVDIFALGVTLYRLFTFEHPWPGSDTSGKAALSHDTEAPTPILEFRPRLAKPLADVIMQSIQADPNKRPDTVANMLQQIRKLTAEEG